MKQINKFGLAIVIAFLFSSVAAQDIISVNELVKNLKNDKYLIVCASKTSDYKVHLPGAINIPHTSLYKDGPVKSMLKPTDEMGGIFAAKGISAAKTIVVYDEGSGKYAGRMYWILKYLGMPNVKMLDGNLKAWKGKRKPITGAPAKVKAATCVPKPVASLLATIGEVKSAIGNSQTVIVDVRADDEFAGTAKTELRKGHIPEAINIDFKNVLNAKGELKPTEELKIVFESKGVTPDKTVILYCESSTRAGVVYLALKSALNYPKVKVFDGAYLEWQATTANKVE